MQTNTKDICDKIIKMDRNIRFVGIVNEQGEVIQGGFQKGVAPLLGETEEQQMYLQSLTHVTALGNYSDQLGKLKLSMTEHEKVTLLTLPLDSGGILCLSLTPAANLEVIKEKIIRTLKDSKSGHQARKLKRSLK